MATVRLPDSLPGENGAESFRDLAECRTVPQRVVVRAAQLIGSIVFRQFGNRCSVYGDLLRAFQTRVQRRRLNGIAGEENPVGVVGQHDPIAGVAGRGKDPQRSAAQIKAVSLLNGNHAAGPDAEAGKVKPGPAG